MAEEITNENGDVLVPDTDRRTVHLRNDNSSTMKFPTIGVKQHEPGEVQEISLRRDEPIPFGFTPVDPEDHDKVLKVDENGVEITGKKGSRREASNHESSSGHAGAAAPAEGSANEPAASEGESK